MHPAGGQTPTATPRDRLAKAGLNFKQLWETALGDKPRAVIWENRSGKVQPRLIHIGGPTTEWGRQANVLAYDLGLLEAAQRYLENLLSREPGIYIDPHASPHSIARKVRKWRRVWAADLAGAFWQLTPRDVYRVWKAVTGDAKLATLLKFHLTAVIPGRFLREKRIAGGSERRLSMGHPLSPITLLIHIARTLVPLLRGKTRLAVYADNIFLEQVGPTRPFHRWARRVFREAGLKLKLDDRGRAWSEWKHRRELGLVRIGEVVKPWRASKRARYLRRHPGLEAPAWNGKALWLVGLGVPNRGTLEAWRKRRKRWAGSIPALGIGPATTTPDQTAGKRQGVRAPKNGLLGDRPEGLGLGLAPYYSWTWKSRRRGRNGGSRKGP